jgi:hypothetical protein
MNTIETPPEIARLPQPMTPPHEARLTPNFESAYICSVFPLARQITLNRMIYVGVSADYPDGYTRRFTYYLPAAKPGSYSVLEITPPLHLIRSPMAAIPNAGAGDVHRYDARPDTAHNEAVSLVQEWSGHYSMAGGNRPGIEVIRGPEPTPEELADLHARQREFSRYFVNEADNFWLQGRRDRIRVGGLHHMCAAYMGIKNDPNHPWVSDMVNAFKACVACGENIISTALVCKHCQQDLLRFCEDRALDIGYIRAIDPQLAGMVETRRTKQEAEAQEPEDDNPPSPRRRRPMPAFDETKTEE